MLIARSVGLVTSRMRRAAGGDFFASAKTSSPSCIVSPSERVANRGYAYRLPTRFSRCFESHHTKPFGRRQRRFASGEMAQSARPPERRMVR